MNDASLERLQTELSEMQSNRELLELFLQDSQSDPSIPADLAEALTQRAHRCRHEEERLQGMIEQLQAPADKPQK